MKSFVEKTRKPKDEKVSNLISYNQGSGKTATQIEDNRSDIAEQAKLQSAADQSARLQQLKAFQAIANSNTAIGSQPCFASNGFVSSPNIGKGVVQAKKSGPINLSKKLAAKFDFKYSEYKDLDVPAYQNLMYQKIGATYAESLAKGTKYWNKLQTALAKYNGEGRAELIEELSAKRAGYDAKFAANYESKSKAGDSQKVQNISTSGLAFEGDEVDPKKDVPYTNKVDFNDNSLYGLHNYAERDMAREADVALGGAEGYEKRGLPNSEILWQQYKLAAQKQYWVKKVSRAKELMKELSAIKRRQVQPVSTLRTIMFAMPDGKLSLSDSHTWATSSEEFQAMLGTPNCSGAVFLLADHVDELDGKTITEIKLLGGEDVNLDIILG